VPDGAVTVSVEVDVPGRVKLEGLILVSSPEGLEKIARDTSPVNPPKGVTVIVVLLCAPPAFARREDGLAATAKPGPLIVKPISRIWSNGPLLLTTPSE